MCPHSPHTREVFVPDTRRMFIIARRSCKITFFKKNGQRSEELTMHFCPRAKMHGCVVQSKFLPCLVSQLAPVGELFSSLLGLIPCFLSRFGYAEFVCLCV